MTTRFLTGVIGAVLVLGACSDLPAPLPPIPPTKALRATTPTTRRPNVAELSVAKLEGSTTTTTINFSQGKGTVTVSGLVTGPDGPVDGATVVIERVVGDQTATLKVLANADGRYKASAIKGGVIRVSAYKVPDLAVAKPKVIYASGVIEIDIETQIYNGTDIQWALGPAQPYIGRVENLSVRVAVKRVDPDGIVRFAALEGIGVRVVPKAFLVPSGPAEKLTDKEGLVSFAMGCSDVGPSGLSVFLASGEETAIEPRACAVPPTTAPPSTKVSGSTVVGQPTLPGETAPPSTRRRIRRTTTIAGQDPVTIPPLPVETLPPNVPTLVPLPPQ
jgi:hypothetical protein